MAFESDWLSIRVEPLGDEGGWRFEADLVVRLDAALEVGSCGFWTCRV
jgi:hypothetical protein